MQRLLVSVRGPNEAIEAASGGAAIADVEFPASALGTPYPLNISAVRERLRQKGFGRVHVSTNIGEQQTARATACQAALGVATAGAGLLKFGLAGLDLDAATYLGRSIIRTVRRWYPRSRLYAAVFADDEFRSVLDPVSDGPVLARAIRADGLLIDTFHKGAGKGLMDFLGTDDLRSVVRRLHRGAKEAWIAGSLQREQLPGLWETGVDVICVRGAACVGGGDSGRFGAVRKSLVRQLVATIPRM